MQESHPPLDTTFFQTLQARGISLSDPLRRYVATLIREDPTPALLNKFRMEDFFKDLFFDFQDSPTDAAIRAAYTDLVDTYARVLRETTNWLNDDGHDGGPVGRLLATAAERAESLTVITFNHDLVIENELFRRARLRPRWCFREGYGAFGASLIPLVTTEPSPRFPEHGPDCDHTRPITVLKLHGSLNWFVRISGSQPTGRMLSGQSGNRQIYVLTSREILERVTITRPDALRGRTRWTTWPVIIPPVYAKQALRRVLQDAWDDAKTALGESDRVVFFGYSLPEIDIEAEKLFERSLATNENIKWADVVNPAPAAAQRYAGLAPAIPIRWFPSLNSFFETQPFAA